MEIVEGSTPVPEGPGLGIDIDEEMLAELAARPKSELPTHVGVLELPGGSTYYTPSIPSAERLSGFPEGNVRGIRSRVWNDDGSEDFKATFQRIQSEGAFKA